MEKWADYLISAVRYEELFNKKTISHCKVHPDNGNSVGAGRTWSKWEILDAISNGFTFFTIYKGNNGKWKKGVKAFITRFEEEYITTEHSNNGGDNLLSIREF